MADVSDLLGLPGDPDFIREAYSRLFFRSPWNDEMSEHLHQLSAASRAFVLEAIVERAVAANPELVIQGRWRRCSAAELSALAGPNLVNEAFRTILWRLPSSEEYVRYLWALDRLGSVKAFLSELASVPEAARYPPVEGLLLEVSHLRSIEPREAFIARAYQTILGREPDTEGLRAAVSALRWLPRKRYLIALATSDEAQSRPAVLLFGGQPILRRSFRASARLQLSTLFDSLLDGLYRRIVSVDMQVAALARNQASLRDDVTFLKAALDTTQSAAQRQRERQEREAVARSEALHRCISDTLAENRKNARSFDAIVRIAFKLAQQYAANTSRLKGLTETVHTMAASRRVQAPVVSVGDRLLVSQVQGFVMAMPSEDVLLTSMLTMYGSIDAGMEAFFSRVLRPGMIFVDVGAHIGLHTVRAASLVGDSGRVYSFEPAPRLFDILTANIVLNGLGGRVVTERKAVSQSSGRSRFILKQQTGLNTLFGQHESGDNIIEVDTVSLDEALHTLPRIDMVKIDAEGAEAAILRGMTRLLTVHPNMQLVIEFAPSLLRRAGAEPLEFASELNRSGFRFSRIDDMSGEAKPTSVEDLLQFESSNVLLTRA
jgi:FkbM family methyltransferase